MYSLYIESSNLWFKKLMIIENFGGYVLNALNGENSPCFNFFKTILALFLFNCHDAGTILTSNIRCSSLHLSNNPR